MFGFTIIRKKELSERMAVEYTKAYNSGYSDGCKDTIKMKCTPNQIRAAFELAPFSKGTPCKDCFGAEMNDCEKCPHNSKKEDD